jgi:predicted HTH domain antitoxin
MSFTISDEVLFATRMTEQEMAMEVAVILYDRGNLPISRAAEFARMDADRFGHLLASRGIRRKPDPAVVPHQTGRT